MSSVNRATILGRLGADPESKALGETTVCRLSVATHTAWTDGKTGEKKEKTQWHRVIVFGRQAETCQAYLTKGQSVFVEGPIETRAYDNAQGVKCYVTEIKAKEVKFLGTRSAEAPTGHVQSGPAPSYAAPRPFSDVSIAEDDVPF